MKSILFLFLDGVGIGEGGSDNPFDNLQLRGFNTLADHQKWVKHAFPTISRPGLVTRAIDANLGVEGLPQSGTGQATLFTGINCAQLAGRHYGPYPHSTSKPVLAEQNVFIQCKELDNEPDSVFLNAFPERFFDMAATRNRWSTTTRCCLDAGIAIRTIDDLLAGRAVAADITGNGLRRIARTKFKPVTEHVAAERMADLSDEYGFLLFEYFHTDKAGHAQDPEMAKTVLESLDRLIDGLLNTLDFDSTTLVVTSDHGNLEDLGVKTHTYNPVPLVAMGRDATHFSNISDLTGVTPAIISALSA